MLRLSVLWLGVAGLAVLRGGGGVTGEGAELSEGWAELREGWVEVRLEVRGQMEDMVVTVVLLRLVTAWDSWLDICQRGAKTEGVRFREAMRGRAVSCFLLMWNRAGKRAGLYRMSSVPEIKIQFIFRYAF